MKVYCFCGWTDNQCRADPKGIWEKERAHARAREDGVPGWTFVGVIRRALLSRAAGGGQQWRSVGVGGVRYGVAGWGGRGYLFILRLTFCSNILLLLSALTSQNFIHICISWVSSSNTKTYM